MFFKNDLSFLSNFYYASFIYKDVQWPTVEHAFQAEKTHDLSLKLKIRVASSPNIAKWLGKKVQIREDWEEVKVGIMTELVFLKFEQNSKLIDKLLDTGETYLEEGNYWHDNFWGNCYCSRCLDIPGCNMLGTILMEIRKFWKEESENRNV